MMKEWEVNGQNGCGHSYIHEGKSIRIGKFEYSSQSPFHEKANALNDPLPERLPDVKWLMGWLTGA